MRSDADEKGEAAAPHRQGGALDCGARCRGGGAGMEERDEVPLVQPDALAASAG